MPDISYNGKAARQQRYAVPPETMHGDRSIHTPEIVSSTSDVIASRSVTANLEQILILDRSWVIVLYNPINDLYEEINTLSSGDLSSQYEAWIASWTGHGGNDLRKNEMRATRDTYLGLARKSIEGPFRNAASYDITSTDDTYYTSAQNPANVGIVNVSMGGIRYGPTATAAGNLWGIDYCLYCYLQMPSTLQDGATYTITLHNGDSVTFDFDLDRTVSRTIKVNQVGYLPDAGVKKAYLGCYLYEFGELDLSHATTFEVINIDTKETALSGSVVLVEAAPVFLAGVNDKPMYGEDVYSIDLSSLSTTGTYYIKVPGVGRSWPFKIGSDIYNEPFYISTRSMYHQRAGTAITRNYTEWTRKKAELGPEWFETEMLNKAIHLPDIDGYKRFDVCGGTLDDTGDSTTEVPGGHHDAADWDLKYIHLLIGVELMYALQWYPHLAGDDILDIPESGDGIPDLLSETRWGLEVWRASQDPVTGGISGQLETWTHTDIESFVGLNSTGPVGAPKCHYGFSTRQRWSSACYAAIAAMYARLIAPYDAADAAIYEASAIAAYDFANDPLNGLGVDFVINAVSNRGRGDPYSITYTEEEYYHYMYLMWAKCQMFLLTDDSTYITDAPSVLTLEADANSKPPDNWRFTKRDWSCWIYYSIIEAHDAGAPGLSTLASDWTDFFTNKADGYLDDLPDSPYPQFLRRKQNADLAYAFEASFNFNRYIAIAYKLSSATKYRDALIQATDTSLGCNPNGMAWCTGIGYVYPVAINHAPSMNDDIEDPVPGIPPYGISASTIPYLAFRLGVWRTDDDDALVSTLTQTGGLATCTTVTNHKLETGDEVELYNATQSEYNIRIPVTVTGNKTFTYDIDPLAVSPATGSNIQWAWFFGTATSPTTGNRSTPMWRAWMGHPTANVLQCEFTIQETNSGFIFNMAALADNYTKPERKKPRPVNFLHGRWYLI